MGCGVSSEEPLELDSVPEPIACYALNDKYKTREIKDPQSEGTLGNVYLAPGRKGRAKGSYRFIGQGDSYIELPNNGGLDVEHSITILCWMYPENIHGLIFKYNTSDPSGIHTRMESGKLLAEFINRNRQCTKLISDQPLPLNQWHHVGSSYDQKTGMASLWLNGQLIVQQNIWLNKEEVMKENIGHGMHLATQDNVRLGATGDRGPYFVGRITTMEIYNVALSRKQIETIGSRCSVPTGNSGSKDLYSRTVPSPVDGGWSNWSDWSPCPPLSRPTSSPTPSPVAPFNTTKSTALPSFTVKPSSSGFTPVMSSSVVSPVTIPPHVQRTLVYLLGSLTRIIQRLQALLGGSLSPADLDNFQNETMQILQQAASQLPTPSSSSTSNMQMEKRAMPDFLNPQDVVQMLDNIQRRLLG